MNAQESESAVMTPPEAKEWAIDHAFYKLNMRTNAISSGDQAQDWLKKGLAMREQGRKPDINELEDSHLSGGRDHPDPWFT